MTLLELFKNGDPGAKGKIKVQVGKQDKDSGTLLRASLQRNAIRYHASGTLFIQIYFFEVMMGCGIHFEADHILAYRCVTQRMCQ